ncbi:hypothetical protein B0H66DRAFT_534990 [Apodospora peruviana]|uniref:Uncharacterized protein n=1 Tax=Apodospora peruviana TaxID=516989 RepID=A0AAE0I332_9PEZI|nr:hypothetical protein B0H66DRAFT_534990 [Apodospora peruviana]
MACSAATHADPSQDARVESTPVVPLLHRFPKGSQTHQCGFRRHQVLSLKKSSSLAQSNPEQVLRGCETYQTYLLEEQYPTATAQSPSTNLQCRPHKTQVKSALPSVQCSGGVQSTWLRSTGVDVTGGFRNRQFSQWIRSLVASIAGICQVCGKVVAKLSDAIDSIRSQRQDLGALQMEVLAIYLTLGQLQPEVEKAAAATTTATPSNVGVSENSSSSSTATPETATETTTTVPWTAELGPIIKSDRWQWNKADVMRLCERLRREKETLTLALSVMMNQGTISSTMDEIRAMVSSLQEQHVKEKLVVMDTEHPSFAEPDFVITDRRQPADPVSTAPALPRRGHPHVSSARAVEKGVLSILIAPGKEPHVYLKFRERTRSMLTSREKAAKDGSDDAKSLYESLNLVNEESRAAWEGYCIAFQGLEQI